MGEKYPRTMRIVGGGLIPLDKRNTRMGIDKNYKTPDKNHTQKNISSKNNKK